MAKSKTKGQERREAAYRKQLKACGYRSWSSANERRSHLIDRDIYGPPLTDEESKELASLQTLADKFLSYKDGGATENAIRRMKRLLEKSRS